MYLIYGGEAEACASGLVARLAESMSSALVYVNETAHALTPIFWRIFCPPQTRATCARGQKTPVGLIFLRLSVWACLSVKGD